MTGDFPVLSAGPPPHTPLPEWIFSIRQAGATLRPWTWPEFRALPASSRSSSSTPTGLGEGISFLFGMTDSAATA